MPASQENAEDQKLKITTEIAEMSRLLAMIPSSVDIAVREPMTGKSMGLSEWLDATRGTLLRLSILIGKALDVQLQ